MVQRLVHVLLGLLVGVSSSLLANIVANASQQTIAAAEQVTASGDEGECGTVASRWSQSNVKEVVKIWKFDADDEAKLKQLGQSLSDVDHWKNDPFEVVRFLTDLNMDVHKSEDMVRKMVEWRLETNMDTFMERYTPPEVLHYNPMCILSGLDRDGDPILVQRHGKLDAWGLYHQLGPDAMLDGNLFLIELISTRGDVIPKEYQWQENFYEPLAGRRLTQFTSIVDLDGLDASVVRPALFNLLRQSARIGQDMYPGLSKRAIVIRAPKVFRMAW